MDSNIYLIVTILILLVVLLWSLDKKNIIEEFKLKNSSEYKIPDIHNSVLPHHPTREDLDFFSSIHTNKVCAKITNKFNDLDTCISPLQVINNEIDLKNVRTNEDTKCINFKNINQCMATCSRTDGCYNFYVDSPGKCCMIINPINKQIRQGEIPISKNRFAHIVANNKILNNEQAKGKIIFNYYGTENNNGISNDKYVGNLTRSQCKSLCPKCITGRCPEDYRCVDMTADPRYNRSCMITNNNNYDENIGKYFDDQNIPYMDEIYGLVEYPGYDSARCPSVTQDKNFGMKCN